MRLRLQGSLGLYKRTPSSYQYPMTIRLGLKEPPGLWLRLPCSYKHQGTKKL